MYWTLNKKNVLNVQKIVINAISIKHARNAILHIITIIKLENVSHVNKIAHNAETKHIVYNVNLVIIMTKIQIHVKSANLIVNFVIIKIHVHNILSVILGNT